VYWLPFRAPLPTSTIDTLAFQQVNLYIPQDPEKFEKLFLCMIIEYESHFIFRLGKSNSASQYDTAPSEYDFIKSSVAYCLDPSPLWVRIPTGTLDSFM
jgi:hypothetical protein